MGTVLNPKRKLCRVATNGPIPELGGIAGPVKGPTMIDMRTVVNMVQHGRVVYEINPKNYKEEVRLTIRNVNQNNFPDKKTVEYPQEKKVVQKSNNIEVEKKEMPAAVQTNLPTAETVKAPDAIDKAMKTYEDAKKEEEKVEAEKNEKHETGTSEQFNKYKDKRDKNRVREESDFTKR